MRRYFSVITNGCIVLTQLTHMVRTSYNLAYVYERLFTISVNIAIVVLLQVCQYASTTVYAVQLYTQARAYVN
jgi:hypothetical protein